MASAPPPPSQSPISKKPSPMMGSMNSPPQHQNIMQSNLGPVPNHMNMQQHMQQQQQQHNNYMQQVRDTWGVFISWQHLIHLF